MTPKDIVPHVYCSLFFFLFTDKFFAIPKINFIVECQIMVFVLLKKIKF